MRQVPSRRALFFDDAEVWYLAGGAPMPVAAYQPLYAPSLALSYLNIVNPGINDATPGVAPTFSSADGWTFNGSSQYLTTGIVPAGNYSMIIKFSNMTSTAVAVLAGIADGSPFPRFYIRSWHTGGQHIWGYGDTVNIVAGTLTSGVVAMTKTAGYLNGAVDSSHAPSWLTTTLPIFIGALNNIGSPFYYVATKIQMIAIWNTNIAAYVPAITAAMNAL